MSIIQSQSASNIPVKLTPDLLPPAPTITDPHANSVITAANRYAQTCDEVTTISNQVKHHVEMAAAAKDKLKEAKANKTAAHAELKRLMAGEKE